MESIEFMTTEEIVDELMKRETFRGIVILSQTEQKQDVQCHDTFTLRAKCGTRDNIREILNLVMQEV